MNIRISVSDPSSKCTPTATLNGSTPVYDLVRGEVYSATDDEPLMTPAEAVVVAGSRNITRGKGKEWGISLYTPVIVKYRDAKTDAKLQFEDLFLTRS